MYGTNKTIINITSSYKYGINYFELHVPFVSRYISEIVCVESSFNGSPLSPPASCFP